MPAVAAALIIPVLIPVALVVYAAQRRVLRNLQLDQDFRPRIMIFR